MRKVLILIALLPGLALADSVGGPSSDQNVQTASPQNAPASLNVLQPAPDASANALAAPANNPANALQGSSPDQATSLEIQSEGDFHPVAGSDQAGSTKIWIIGLTLLAFVLLAAAAALWQTWAGGGSQP